MWRGVVSCAFAAAAVVVCVLSVCVQGFGHSLLPEFAMDPAYVNLNHGSYGSVPRSVLAVQSDWRARVERNPDRFFRYDVFTAQDTVRNAIAQYIGTDPANVVFVINASHGTVRYGTGQYGTVRTRIRLLTGCVVLRAVCIAGVAGVNSVLRSILNFQPTDTDRKVLYLSTAYQMVVNTLTFLQEQNGAELLRVNVSFANPAYDPDAVVQAVADALDAQPPGSVRLACFSHITSIPALILPVERLVQVCHDRGVLVMLDGAHALGHIPVNVTAIGADFWLGNGHKWLYSPKGTCALYVAPGLQARVFPPTISDEGVGASAFQKLFSYEGTWDYSGILSMASALAFRATVASEQQIMQYMHTLAVDGGALLAQAWGTEKLGPYPAPMHGAHC
jgi:selenocysteine lyase/cysteine desulfurase